MAQHIQASFGRYLSFPLRHQRRLVREEFEGNENHFLGGGHLEVQAGRDRFAQAPDVIILDMSSVLPQVHGDAVGAREFRQQRGGDRVRLGCLTRLPDSGYMVHIYSQLGHVNPPGFCEAMCPPFLNANDVIVHTCESEVGPVC